MKRYLLLVVFLIYIQNGLLAQEASWDIRFNGKDKTELYKNHNITTEDNREVLDFSKNSKNRTPINFHLSETNSPKSSFSIFTWIKSPKDLRQSTVIISNKKNENSDGWEIRANNSGAWEWDFTHNGEIFSQYKSTSERQTISDGKYHLVGFTYDYIKNQLWLYYDGRNVGIINLDWADIDLSGFNNMYIGGFGNLETESFNGYFKSVHLFNSFIDRTRVKRLYNNDSKYSGKVGVNGAFYKNIKILTWDITDGGTMHGKKVGLDRVLEIIKNSKADVIAIQEANESAVYLADGLGYYYYSISEKLAILSRFPFKKTIKLYLAKLSGGVEIEISKKQTLIFFNVVLGKEPDWSRPNTDVYSDEFVTREQNTRARDMSEMVNQVKVLLKPKLSTSIMFCGELNFISTIDTGVDIKKSPLTNIINKVHYIDSYRKTNPSVEEYPGFTRNNNSKDLRKGRVDYIYYRGTQLNAVKSSLIKDHHIKFPSNNYGIVTQFIWKK